MKQIILPLLITTLTLQAHDIWIDDAQKIIYGHIKESSEDSHAKNRVIEKSELLSFTCQKLSSHAKNCDSIFAELKPAYYTKTPYGTKNTPKNETAMALSSHLSHESVKRIDTQEGLKPHKKGLELTLENSLDSLRMGDKLRVVVLEEGNPKAGVTVAYDDKSIGISDENGHVNIKIRHAGLQMIRASYTQKSDGVKCDEIIYSTTLNITVHE